MIEDYARDYSRLYRNSFEFWVARVRHDRIAASLQKYQPKTILEIGSGPDPVVFYWKGDWERYVAIDPVKEYIAATTDMASRLGLRVETIQCKLEDCDLEGPFDYVILSSLLHEVANPEEFLLTAKRFCHSGSVVHVNVPNVNSLHMLLGVEMGILGDVFDETETVKGIPRPTSFDMAKLLNMMTACGFAVIDSGTYLLKPFSNAQMAQLADDELVEGLKRMIRLPQLRNLGCELFVEAGIVSDESTWGA